MKTKPDFVALRRVLEKVLCSNEPDFEKWVLMREGFDPQDPLAYVWRIWPNTSWASEKPSHVSNVLTAIWYADRIETLRYPLLSDFGRLDPRRVCEWALKGTEFDGLNETDLASALEEKIWAGMV
jgi:hypothetical protein